MDHYHYYTYRQGLKQNVESDAIASRLNNKTTPNDFFFASAFKTLWPTQIWPIQAETNK